LVLEEQTPHLYLNLLNRIAFFLVCIFFILSSYIFLFLNYKRIFENENTIIIPKGAGIHKIVDIILVDKNYLNKKIYFSYLWFFDKYFDQIKFGEFKIDKNLNLIQITNKISKPSDVYKEFKIIGGWQIYQLEKLIKEKFNNSYFILYNEILADTYKYQSHNEFEDIFILMKNNKDKFFIKNKDNFLLKKYSINEIMTIASLVEKEGKTVQDQKLISSVIFNRLDNNLKLQIDATTIYSITKGKYKLNRKLTYQDLKIKDKYNTYFIGGLPPDPICYVSRKTIEIVLENYKSNYLFYFFDEKDQKHVFSSTYKKHKKLLEIYRNNE